MERKLLAQPRAASRGLAAASTGLVQAPIEPIKAPSTWATQVNLATWLVLRRLGPPGGGSGAPCRGINPIASLGIEVVQLSFIRSAERRRLVLRSLLDGLASQVDEYLVLTPTDTFNPFRRDQYVFPGPPVFGIDDQVTDCPAVVIDQEIRHVSDLAIPRLDEVVGHVARAP